MLNESKCDKGDNNIIILIYTDMYAYYVKLADPRFFPATSN